MTKFGPRSITTAIVADASQTMKLVIWSHELLEQLREGGFYCISFLRVKMFEKGQLNTTPQTKVIPIPPFEDVKSDIEEICHEQVINVQLQSVQVLKKISCPICFKILDSNEYQQPLVRCSSCNFKVLTTSLPTQISVVAYAQIDGQQKKLQVSTEAVETLVTAESKPELKDDLDAFEDFLILNKFEIHLSTENIVTKMRKC
ncbi:uncharacterized protein LOC123535734 [Mercenaria mercenaria]|uniref:uncharacterized protein LOC123535734 n=1 Tax=Mercenaria mercenaria TaxID=6596 RepID=UPI00234E6713|nr:uncharacterized protein LOC123535734 [Mercenaria mercenaria]